MKDLLKLFAVEEEENQTEKSDDELKVEDIENVAGGRKGPRHQKGRY